MEAKQVCGQCNDEWLTEKEYLAHTCPTTSANPTEAAHQGPEFIAIQAAALQRGLDELDAKGKDTTSQEIAIELHAKENGLV